LLALLACGLVAGCAAGDDGSTEADRADREAEQALQDRARIGDPLIAADAPPGQRESRRGLVDEESEDSREGLVEGTPSVEELDELPPPVALGDRSAACPNGSAVPEPGNLQQLEAPIRCLLNAQRAARGLGPLSPNARLRVAALGHSQDMVAKKYFGHKSQSGTSPADRIRRAGWMPRGGGWVVGENLAWGTGALATPAKIVDAWMASPGHKANILRRKFRQIGVGISAGVPVGGGAGATYATTFGGRP
jgi:uncharacterized protein YkwD